LASHYLRKYATATTVDFELYKLDGTGLKSDAASATHDIKIMKDEGNEADTERKIIREQFRKRDVGGY
jgi:hypothetical protein